MEEPGSLTHIPKHVGCAADRYSLTRRMEVGFDIQARRLHLTCPRVLSA